MTPAAIATFLDQIEIGAPTAFERLTLWPLAHKARGSVDATGARLAYRPLAEALGRGEVVVEEISDTGSVPNVRVRSLCDEALLVLFGEELRGAKQNRIANASFLIPPRGEVVIDVSCVEAGRWRSHAPGRAGPASDPYGYSPRFDTSGPVVSQQIRRKMLAPVYESRAAAFTRTRPRSGTTWPAGCAIPEPNRAPARGPTCTPRAAFAPSGIGFVAALDGEIVGLELIGDPRVYASSFAGLLDAYLIDAIADAPSRPAAAAEAPNPPDPAAFLARVHDAPATAAPSLGLGEDLRLQSDAVEGAALVAGASQVVHLTAAPRARQDVRPGRREPRTPGEPLRWREEDERMREDQAALDRRDAGEREWEAPKQPRKRRGAG